MGVSLNLPGKLESDREDISTAALEITAARNLAKPPAFTGQSISPVKRPRFVQSVFCQMLTLCQAISCR
jgi:polysaccharide pyruvyl transferase WcaK-like protein